MLTFANYIFDIQVKAVRMNIDDITIAFAEEQHAVHAPHICDLIYESALQRGTGIARRSNEYISAKIKGGKAVVALHGDKLVGFSYIECWGHGDFVATSGLIVDPEYRHLGLAHETWLRGDDYTGDPAQEQQGLNSVFASDSTTIAVIHKHTTSLFHENKKDVKKVL